jgi:hypothetical protein
LQRGTADRPPGSRVNQGQIGMSTEGIRQFIDEKSFKPGIGTYDLTKQPKHK